MLFWKTSNRSVRKFSGNLGLLSLVPLKLVRLNLVHLKINSFSRFCLLPRLMPFASFVFRICRIPQLPQLFCYKHTDVKLLKNCLSCQNMFFLLTFRSVNLLLKVDCVSCEKSQILKCLNVIVPIRLKSIKKPFTKF